MTTDQIKAKIAKKVAKIAELQFELMIKTAGEVCNAICDAFNELQKGAIEAQEKYQQSIVESVKPKEFLYTNLNIF